MGNGLPYIPNKRFYKAVTLSLSVMRDGTHPGVADRQAAEYYGCLLR